MKLLRAEICFLQDGVARDERIRAFVAGFKCKGIISFKGSIGFVEYLGGRFGAG